MWGVQSCPRPAFSRLDPLESGSAAKIGRPTILIGDVTLSSSFDIPAVPAQESADRDPDDEPRADSPELLHKSEGELRLSRKIGDEEAAEPASHVRRLVDAAV